jgi:hypothetical protein
LKYFSIGSKDERLAGKAIARLLRRKIPLDRQLRRELACLFDPPKGRRRKLVIVGQGQGRPNDPIRKTQIASSIYTATKKNGKTKTAAIADAAKKFCITPDAARKIWAKYEHYGELLDDGGI